MTDQEIPEYVTALAVGALVGLGAALLLRPKRRTRRERIVRAVKPYGQSLGKGARRAGSAVSDGAGRAYEWSEEMADAGREVLDDFRRNLMDIARSAQDEIAETVAHQLKEARKAAARGADKVRG